MTQLLGSLDEMERSCKIRNSYLTVWFAFCLIVTITSLIIYFTADDTFFRSYNSAEHYVEKLERVKFNTLLNYRNVGFNATWVSDDEILTQDQSGNIILHNVNKSTKSILVFNTMQHIKYCTNYELSADKKYLLITYNYSANFSYLSKANYDVINVKTGKQVTLLDDKREPREMTIARWSPVDSSLAFVGSDYDVYYVPTMTKPNAAKRLTSDGSKDLYNGVADWMYSKEIFGSNRAMWFSTGGTKLAYAVFDESSVPLAYIPQYGIPDTMYDQYSTMFKYRYPKVNDSIPTVKLFVQILSMTNESNPILIKPTKQYANETILYKVVWSNDEHLFVMWMNRLQTECHLVHYYISGYTVNVIEAMEFEQENGWLEFHRSLCIGPGHRVALIYRTEQNDHDTYGHVCVIERDGERRWITSGQFEVTRLVKWDLETNYIYYVANLENGPEKQHVFRVLVDPKRTLYESECLTCSTQCAMNDAVFSQKTTYFSHVCTGPNVPYVNIMKTTGDHRSVAEWENNKKLRRKLDNVNLPKVFFITVPLDSGFDARVRLTVPRSINMSSAVKYPLIIHTPSEPSSNAVLDEFRMDVNTYLSANHLIIVATIDGQGTGGRGSRVLYADYKRLGTGDVDDQIAVARYLQNTMPYIDRNKTVVWGLGYGGYLAGMILARDQTNTFKCALSVAPITDWIYYDSVYAERFLGSYAENFEGYRNASLIENAEGLRGKMYMLVHGTFDKTVLYQHSAMLAKELQHKGIEFEQQFYPDESHDFTNVKYHLYHTIIKYILKCFA